MRRAHRGRRRRRLEARSMLIGTFYGRFFAWVNFLGFAFQLLLVSRLFK